MVSRNTVTFRLVVLFLGFFAASALIAAPPFRILITNDDGYEAEGITVLAEELAKIAEVTVCAPMENSSGAGHSITVDGPIKIKEIKKNGKLWGYAANCTPASCVKMGLQMMKERPNLVVSGINEGGNLGQVVLVSGTFGAAQEAVMQGIPAIASSLERDKKNMDYQPGAEFLRTMVEDIIARGMPVDTVFNVNFPACSREEIQGSALTTLSRFNYTEIWYKRTTPWGQNYFWSKIQKPSWAPVEGSDWWAVENNLISVTPVSVNFAPPEPKAYFRHLQLGWENKPYRNFMTK